MRGCVADRMNPGTAAPPPGFGCRCGAPDPASRSRYTAVPPRPRPRTWWGTSVMKGTTSCTSPGSRRTTVAIRPPPFRQVSAKRPGLGASSATKRFRFPSQRWFRVPRIPARQCPAAVSGSWIREETRRVLDPVIPAQDRDAESGAAAGIRCSSKMVSHPGADREPRQMLSGGRWERDGVKASTRFR